MSILLASEEKIKSTPKIRLTWTTNKKGLIILRDQKSFDCIKRPNRNFKSIDFN